MRSGSAVTAAAVREVRVEDRGVAAELGAQLLERAGASGRSVSRRAPRALRALAIAFPIPPLAPVRRTLLPASCTRRDRNRRGRRRPGRFSRAR